MEDTSRYQINEDFKKPQKISWYLAPIFVILWIALYLTIVVMTINNLPTPLTRKDEQKNFNRFIAERAEETLLELTKLGPRVVGSRANEYEAVDFLLKKIESIRQNASKNFVIETDVQQATGSYIHWTMINMYQGIQNVVVKLSGTNSSSKNYLLINSHYDSAPGSPGGGDDGTMVAVMLEVMRVISKSKEPLEHPIIFLFNGAEENPLQASHAFITQHKWAKYCKALINLDSAGNGGRELLFQSGPNHPWLMKYYCQNVPHPFATTIAEELFQNNFIPSDTDFRIFRDYGGVPGLDLAHSYNGYVYHTKYDRSNIVPRGTFQNTGDNILELAKAIANAPEMHDTSAHQNGHVIFYDFLGWYVIYYSQTAGVVINLVVCLIAIITIIFSTRFMSKSSGIKWIETIKRYAITFLIHITSLVLGMVLSLAIAAFMDKIDRSMSWFSNNWLIFGLYFCPMLFGMLVLPTFYLQKTRRDKLSLAFRVQLFMNSHCIFLVMLTLCLTAFGIRSSFLPMIAVLFETLASTISIVIKLQRKASHLALTTIACQILPFLYFSYLVCLALYTLIPMAGRSGSSSNPEIIIAAISVFTCILFAGFLLPILLLFQRTKIIVLGFFITTVIFILLAVTPIGFPYTKETAVQRFSLIHTKRVLHNSDMTLKKSEAGIYVYPQDRHINSVDEPLDFITEDIRKVSDLCHSEMFCGLPIFNHRWNKARENSFWIPFEEVPIFPGTEPKLQLLNKSINSTNPLLTTFEFEVSGPDHMTIFIDSNNGSKITNWSFKKTMIRDSWTPPFFIYYSYGKDSSPLNFFIETKTSDGNFTKPTLAIGIGAHWIHQSNIRSKKYQEILDSFPKWAYVSDWVGSYENWFF